MNKKMIVYALGKLLMITGILMFIPVIVSLIYQEKTGICYAGVGIAIIIIGFLISKKEPKKKNIYAREGFVIVALGWILVSLVGAIPFCLSGEIPSYVDAVFETVSGFTTTGASILADVESLPRSIIFWRSFTHWIGGMGVLVLLLSLLPLAGGSHMNLMKAESPGPSVSRLVPKVRSTAKILYGIYLFITVIEVILLLLGGASLFDSLTIYYNLLVNYEDVKFLT